MLPHILLLICESWYTCSSLHMVSTCPLRSIKGLLTALKVQISTQTSGAGLARSTSYACASYGTRCFHHNVCTQKPAFQRRGRLHVYCSCVSSLWVLAFGLTLHLPGHHVVNLQKTPTVRPSAWKASLQKSPCKCHHIHECLMRNTRGLQIGWL